MAGLIRVSFCKPSLLHTHGNTPASSYRYQWEPPHPGRGTMVSRKSLVQRQIGEHIASGIESIYIILEKKSALPSVSPLNNLEFNSLQGSLPSSTTFWKMVKEPSTQSSKNKQTKCCRVPVCCNLSPSAVAVTISDY